MPCQSAVQDPLVAPERSGVLREGLLWAAAVLLLIGPPAQRPSPTALAPAPIAPVAGAVAASPVQPTPKPPPAPLLAQFGSEVASADAQQIARWAFHSGDHQQRAVVVVDKKAAKVYVFDQGGRLQGAAPALLGSAIGDHTVPGIGDKPLAQVLPAERTTPAGRFIAEPGLNANGEDVVWVDYDAAVSMHRVRANVKAERRLERLASKSAKDNRISFGCINLPVSFYEKVLSPAVRRTGAVVYVLPETQPAAPLFGAYDVPNAARGRP